jgi:hypothetical protein
MPLLELSARSVSSNAASLVPSTARTSADQGADVVESFNQLSLQSDIQRALADLSEIFIICVDIKTINV